MNDERTEKVLQDIAKQTVPGDVHDIAKQKAQQFTESLTEPTPYISWRIIMRSPITKLAAAAMILIAVYAGIQISGGLSSTAYALQDTIEAYNSIRWLHIYTISQETKISDIWLAFDDQGNTTRARFQSDDFGDPIGPLTVTWDSGNYQAWLARHNLQLVGHGDPSTLLSYDVFELDPKYLLEELSEQESRDEAIVDVNEPKGKREPIIVTVTYPPGSRSENWKKVFHINQATKLVTRIDKLERWDGVFHHLATLEFVDYNQQIDEMMFTLDDEVPTDARIVDTSGVESGLSQGNMTDKEIAAEIATQFFEAVIARDFDRAGQLYLGVPGFLVEQSFMGANAIEIISIGPTLPYTNPDSDAMLSSYKLLVEFDGDYYEVSGRVNVARKKTNRWVITWLSANSIPASGTITLSRDRADLSAVIYDGLEPGELMQKWLILDPVRIEVRGDTLFPSEETQKEEFVVNHVNTAQFEPQVSIGEKDYGWSVLECDYGTIDLTSIYEDSYLITYAWAQIDMSEKTRAVLGIGSDDGVKVWLNGELVHENWILRAAGIDNDRVPVTFKKGTNQLVLKIQNAGGSWGFCCRLLDE